MFPIRNCRKQPAVHNPEKQDKKQDPFRNWWRILCESISENASFGGFFCFVFLMKSYVFHLFILLTMYWWSPVINRTPVEIHGGEWQEKKRKNILRKQEGNYFCKLRATWTWKRFMGVTGLSTLIHQNFIRNNSLCISFVSHMPCHIYGKIFVTESKIELEKAQI